MRYRFSFLCFFVLFLSQLSPAQNAEKVWFDKTDSVYGYYIVIKPASNLIQGALVLLDGYRGNADGFLSETKMHNVAAVNNILTVCIPTGTRLYLDNSMTELMNRILNEVKAKYNLRKDKFALGGMSSGGTIALRYTERCYEKPGDFPILPKAVFDIDSPLDLVDLYKSSQRDLQKTNGGWWLEEAQMIVDRFNKELGGINGDMKKYKEVSPFLREQKDSANEKYLKNTAVRTYHDVDVNWFIQNRSRSLYETNLLDGSELINRLVQLGNKEAEFIASKIPGRRSDGTKHPHSWNIADEIDLIQWVKEKLNFYPEHIANLYSYAAPENWDTEKFIFPFSFAPVLTYKGFEDIRFAPGWGKKDSKEKWAYTFLWWLDDTYSFNEKIIKENLEAYFSGLTKQRGIESNLNMTAYTPATFDVQKVKTVKGDIETYSAAGSIFDAFVTKSAGNLFIKVHVKECKDKSKTILLFEISANTFNQPVWQQLDLINENFRCN
jgi:Alpha/beta hydrolase of unknown function (DUF915)